MGPLRRRGAGASRRPDSLSVGDGPNNKGEGRVNEAVSRLADAGTAEDNGLSPRSLAHRPPGASHSQWEPRGGDPCREGVEGAWDSLSPALGGGGGGRLAAVGPSRFLGYGVGKGCVWGYP